jgi:Delta7-sterol 5-desaturase
VVYQWIYYKFSWPGLLGASLFFGLIFYICFVPLSYYYYFVRHRDDYVPDYHASPRLLALARRWSVWNILGNSALILPIQWLIGTGHSRLYDGVAAHGWGYLVLSAIGALAFAETAIYWIHRMLHVGWFMRHLHAIHHRFREPTPVITYAFHPLDSFLQSLPYHLYAFVIPLNSLVYLAFFIFSSFWALMIHERVRWVPGGIVNNAGCHTAHHWFCRYNYGNNFTFWDRLCGTYYDPARLPEKFFAVRQPAWRLSRRELD